MSGVLKKLDMSLRERYKYFLPLIEDRLLPLLVPFSVRVGLYF